MGKTEYLGKTGHLDDAAFMEALRKERITPPDFDHAAHIRLAFLLLREQGFDEALERMRPILRALFRRSGVAESLERGYHETLTQAWLRITEAVMHHHPIEGDSRVFLAENAQLAHRRLIRMYYTRQRLVAAEAKESFVEPDIAPLPRA